MATKNLPPRKGLAGPLVSENEQVMAVVKSCSHMGCFYQTNIKGDMARHRKEKHARP